MTGAELGVAFVGMVVFAFAAALGTLAVLPRFPRLEASPVAGILWLVPYTPLHFLAFYLARVLA